MVGGLQVPTGKSLFQRATGMAMTSILGAGNSSHKIGGQEGPTDTVYLGVFRREPLVAAGYFDETLIRNQDYELNWRLRRSPARPYGWTRSLLVDYQPRRSLKALWRQYFEYGWWKAIMLRRNPRLPEDAAAGGTGTCGGAAGLLRVRARRPVAPGCASSTGLSVGPDPRLNVSVSPPVRYPRRSDPAVCAIRDAPRVGYGISGVLRTHGIRDGANRPNGAHHATEVPGNPTFL